MANNGVKGRIVDAETGAGISDLTVIAVDFDPFFNEDDILSVGKTNGNGNFELTYSADAYSLWFADRSPDIVVQVLGPRFEDPKLFGTRLLFETKEVEDVTDDILDVPEIKIHRNNIEGWLVTNATLNPESGKSAFLFQGNAINHLIDGDKMFPAITEATKKANSSINLMTLFFAVGEGLVTQFKSSFNPSGPLATSCKSQIDTTLEIELKKKAKLDSGQPGIPVNVMVANIPLSATDTVLETRKFFENSGVNTTDFVKALSLLHAKAMVFDGATAILMGSPLKQFYFNDKRHAILDARHKGSLFHDVSIEVAGPAVASIDKTFSTVWKATGKSFLTVSPDKIDERQEDNVASVQVLRTLPGGTFTKKVDEDENLPHGETGILEAYQRAISNAHRYIYLENQYFTSPEIVSALISRMKDKEKPKLQIILVINFHPDLPGYPEKQIDLFNQLKAVANATEHKLGIYTLWSRFERIPGDSSGENKEIDLMPIYVHSKVAIIDDAWATVGSANLDGTSLNHHQIGLMVSSVIFDMLGSLIGLENDARKMPANIFFYFLNRIGESVHFSFTNLLAFLFILYKIVKNVDEILESLTEVWDISEIGKDAFARPAQHALPHRSRQPSRSVELNVVLYNGIAGQPETKVIHELRQQLWTEHLGLESLPQDMQIVPDDQTEMNWVEFWDIRAKTNQLAINQNLSPPENHIKVLKWTPETDADDYLKALKITTKGLKNKAFQFDFEKCRFKPSKKVIEWPI